jgi:hypothetical protein
MPQPLNEDFEDQVDFTCYVFWILFNLRIVHSLKTCAEFQFSENSVFVVDLARFQYGLLLNSSCCFVRKMDHRQFRLCVGFRHVQR